VSYLAVKARHLFEGYFQNRGSRTVLAFVGAEQIVHILLHVGMNFLESSSCSLNDSGNAAIPATIPATMKITDTMDQITPQHCEEPPYL